MAVSQDRFLELAREGAPREAVNPLREAVVLYDKDFISGLKKELETGAISLKKDAYRDYLRAYFLYEYNEMILSVKMLRKRIEGENRAVAVLYEKILEGDYDRDFVDAVREWVGGRIGAEGEGRKFECPSIK